MCFDDHQYGGPCTPKTVGSFSPAKDDHSYIAEQFRKLESKCARQAELLERAYEILDGSRDNNARKWLSDYELLKEEK